MNLNLLWELLWDQAWPCPLGSDFPKLSWSDSTIFFEVLNLYLLWKLLWGQAWPCPSSSDFFEMIMIGFNHILWSPEFESQAWPSLSSSDFFKMIMVGFNHILWSPEFESLVRIAMGSSVALSIKFWLFQNDHDGIQPYSLKSWILISCENCYGIKPDLVHQLLTFLKWSWWDSTIFFEVLNLT